MDATAFGSVFGKALIGKALVFGNDLLGPGFQRGNLVCFFENAANTLAHVDNAIIVVPVIGVQKVRVAAVRLLTALRKSGSMISGSPSVILLSSSSVITASSSALPLATAKTSAGASKHHLKRNGVERWPAAQQRGRVSEQCASSAGPLVCDRQGPP
jgi:hypothetical protein